MSTINECRQQFETARSAIYELDQALSEERRRLKMSAFAKRRALTPGERERLRDISATRGELAEGLKALVLDALEQVEGASDLDELLQEIALVNEVLAGDIEYLQAIESYAELCERLVKGLTDVAEKLVDLRSAL